MKDIETDASLALDGHKVVLDAIGIHELDHVGTHVAAEEARGHHIIAQLQQNAAHVETLAAGGLFGRYTVDVVDSEFIELVAGIDRRVHGYGKDHDDSYSGASRTAPFLGPLGTAPFCCSGL